MVLPVCFGILNVSVSTALTAMEVGLNKALVLVLDGVGTGELPDAGEYGDCGSDTLGNTARAVGGLHLPNLGRMGLGNIHPIEGVDPVEFPEGSWGKMAERSRGKDSTTGHWEMMGIVSEHPMPTFPGGFPPELIERYSELTGRIILGNEVASGTEILERLGEKQVETGGLIVYTSADSVFQVAAHQDVVPVDELYEHCKTARKMLQPPEFGVGRVIARPFTGSKGSFTRTAQRRDFSLPPPGETLLDLFASRGIPVQGVGKIDDLFAHRNIETVHAGSNDEEMLILEKMTHSNTGGFIFANFCDFDTKWGHRNNFQDFAGGLEALDKWLPSLIKKLHPGDLMLITADHGNDPTTESTDHSREFVPLLCYSPGVPGRDLGVRDTFTDIACTLCDFFRIPCPFPGSSFLKGVI